MQHKFDGVENCYDINLDHIRLPDQLMKPLKHIIMKLSEQWVTKRRAIKRMNFTEPKDFLDASLLRIRS